MFYYVGSTEKIKKIITEDILYIRGKYSYVGTLYGEAQVTNHSTEKTEIIDLGYGAIETDLLLMNISCEIRKFDSCKEAIKAIHDRAIAIAHEYRFFELKKVIRRPDGNMIKYKASGPYDKFIEFEFDGKMHTVDLYRKEDNGQTFKAYFDFNDRRFMLYKYLLLEQEGTTLHIEVKEL